MAEADTWHVRFMSVTTHGDSHAAQHFAPSRNQGQSKQYMQYHSTSQMASISHHTNERCQPTGPLRGAAAAGDPRGDSGRFEGSTPRLRRRKGESGAATLAITRRLVSTCTLSIGCFHVGCCVWPMRTASLLRSIRSSLTKDAREVRVRTASVPHSARTCTFSECASAEIAATRASTLRASASCRRREDDGTN